jgi:SAM-dependent methyltransferase
MASDVAVDRIFDQPSLWRLEAAQALGLDNTDLISAVSPGPSYPMALRSLAASFPPSPASIVDLGAGGGGTSEWFRTETGATVYAIEPAPGARLAATLSFPHLRVLEGRADRAPLPDGIADAVTLCGVLSLLTDLGSVFEEVDRLLAPGGTLAIADMFSNGQATCCNGRNVFRSIEDLDRGLQRIHFTVISVGCGPPTADPEWVEVSQTIDDWIHDHCAARDGYAEWTADQQHLRRQVGYGTIIGGCVAAARRTDNGRSPW